MNYRIIGIDPGETCGMVVLDGGQITSVLNIKNIMLSHKITPFLLHSKCTVVIEDLRPFSLRLTPQVISTAKFLGELIYRLKNEAGCTVELVVRNDVKKWCFDQYPEICVPIIDKIIDKKGYKNKETGDNRKASFVFVNDKIVTECMKKKYGIPKPPPGSGYMYGLKDHSWQALAVATLWDWKLTEI